MVVEFDRGRGQFSRLVPQGITSRPDKVEGPQGSWEGSNLSSFLDQTRRVEDL